jgi:membrane-associated PAP2 superfamily phosphatase
MHLFFIFWQVFPTLVHIIFVATVSKRIIIDNYSYNKIYDEHTVDMLLPLNTIEEFLITRFVDVKRVHYKYVTYLQIYHC